MAILLVIKLIVSVFMGYCENRGLLSQFYVLSSNNELTGTLVYIGVNLWTTVIVI